jgi:hypothetical protein
VLPGIGDLACAAIDRDERNLITCGECGNLFEPRDGADICPSCEKRLHPRCACGCGGLAKIVADTLVMCDNGKQEHIEREPWVDIEHALGANDATARTSIIPLDPLKDIIAAAPCWCHMRENTDTRAGTVVGWCPHCGVRG